MPTELLYKNLELVIDQIRLLVVALDHNGRVIYANPYFLHQTGYKYDEIANKDFYNFFLPPDKAEAFDKQLQAIVTSKYSMKSESQLLKKDGSKIYVDWHNFPLEIDKGTVGMISVGVDITSNVEMVHLLSLNEQTMRARAELFAKQNAELETLEEALQEAKHSVEAKVEKRTAELNEEKARMLASINSIPHGFMVTDNDDNVIMTNNKMETIFDVKKVEWRLNDLKDFTSGSINFLKYYGLVKTSKKPHLIKDIDLERKFLEIYIAPIFLSPLSNDTIGSTILVSDVTEQKIIQRSKDEFFSIASHELRTPLTAIRGNAEMVKKYYHDKVHDESFDEMISDIETSSDRLISLVNEFLNMSRLEQGKMQFRAEEFDITQLIVDVIKELGATAQAKNLFINFEQPKDKIGKVFADSDRVREILINLISNAISYTEKGGCTVSVEPGRRQIKIRVNDTGKGIPAQNQNLLFRKFQQANPSLYMRDVSKSTGLGLYISKLMIEEMRGTIYLEKSEVGVGSTFVFTLPLA
jgi:PAS domain S-box-containing protein